MTEKNKTKHSLERMQTTVAKVEAEMVTRKEFGDFHRVSFKKSQNISIANRFHFNPCFSIFYNFYRLF